MFTDRHTLPVLGAIAACTLPHFLNVSLWVVLACLGIWVFTITAAKYAWRLPGRFIMGLLAVLLFTAAMSTHEGFTIEAFVAVLALMVSLKLLEVRAGRDRIITVIFCYFLIVAGLFFDDSVGATSYMLVSILFTTAVLIHVNQPGHGFIPPLKLSWKLMVQALPIALVLFLFFPRIQGSLWGRAPVNSAQTGFSDTMSFGNIAELARNTDVAFRVEFDDIIPPQNRLYWRGIVLWEFDGETWQRGIKSRNAPVRTWKPFQRVDYTITLEPHNEHWLLTLDLPMRINLSRAWLNSDHTSYRWWPITQRVIYSGISDLGANDPQDNQLLDEALVLPETGNPRARALARTLYAKNRTTIEYIEQVLKYFRNQNFSYTLRPPPLTTNSDYGGTGPESDLVDRFLFHSRKGFCEHFASSFAFLMRAAGVPARIVLGYQGGSQNKYGGYLVVRQSDAHAWCEVWMPEKGWTRVDPTGAVASTRLTGDTANALPPGETGLLLSLMHYGPLGEWFGTTMNVWDFVNSRWNRWIMDYSPYDDLDFFVRLGLDIESKKGWGQAMLIALVAAAAITGMVIVPFFFRPQRNDLDETARAWMDFCRKLGRIGLPRRPEQGPVDYMNYVANQQPELAHRVREITSAYIRLRYSSEKNVEDTKRLKLLIRRFSPRKTNGSS